MSCIAKSAAAARKKDSENDDNLKKGNSLTESN